MPNPYCDLRAYGAGYFSLNRVLYGKFKFQINVEAQTETATRRQVKEGGEHNFQGRTREKPQKGRPKTIRHLGVSGVVRRQGGKPVFGVPVLVPVRASPVPSVVRGSFFVKFFVPALHDGCPRGACPD